MEQPTYYDVASERILNLRTYEHAYTVARFLLEDYEYGGDLEQLGR